MLPGQVYGYREEFSSFPSPSVYRSAHFLKHIAVKPAYIPVFFKQRNKITRGYHSFLRMLPSHQRLRTRGFFILKTDLRLKIYFKIPVFQSAPEHGIQFMLLFHFLSKTDIIKHTAVLSEFLLVHAGRHYPVLYDGTVQIRFIYQIGSLAEGQMIGVLQVLIKRVNLPDDFLKPCRHDIPVSFFQTEEKIVRISPGRYFSFLHIFPEDLHTIMQRPVSLMSSEAFVYHLKITDIDYRYRVLIPAGVLQRFPQLQAEGGIVHSSRHSIHKGDILQTPSVVPVY